MKWFETFILAQTALFKASYILSAQMLGDWQLTDIYNVLYICKYLNIYLQSLTYF